MHITLTGNLGSGKSTLSKILEADYGYEIFSTGISYIRDAIDVTKFKKRIFNFGMGSQELYYDYQK